MTGPLAGLRIVEIGSLGPGPHAMMMMADLGADVVRVARPVGADDSGFGDIQDSTLRGRRQLRADLKSVEGREVVLALATRADALIEGFRPGVAERLGIGPKTCHELNPRLVYARMTGWGQHGPLAARAGHDINYLSLSGALNAMGPPDHPPLPPLNLVGDFGGGSMFLLAGVLSALIARGRTGRGDVLDVAMVDGVAALMQPLLAMRETGTWMDQRGQNLLDGGAPFYATYTCADGRYVAVGALEPAFFAQLVDGLGLDTATVGTQYDRARWPQLRALLATRFLQRTRDEWAETFVDTDACVTPVLSFGEAPAHPHMASRRTFEPAATMATAAPAPRFAAHPDLRAPGPAVDATAADVLASWTEESPLTR